MNWLKTLVVSPVACGLSLTLIQPAAFSAEVFQSELHAGPLFDKFNLTLPGNQPPDASAPAVSPSPSTAYRVEALGPLFYSEHQDSQHTWALPPLFAYTHDPETESWEYDIAYPLLSYDRFGEQYRWHLFQLLSWAGGPSQNEKDRHRFTLFPIYFQQRSSLPDQNYTAFFPFYGRLKNRIFRDEIFFVSFPFYSQTRKKDVVTDNYFYPFYHQRHGNGLTGWQLWPFTGQEHKEVTSETNSFNDVSMVPGFDRRFVMGPIYYNETNGIGADNPEWERGSLPAFDIMRSPKRDSTTVIWPFFSWIDNREKKYKEKQILWPFVVLARGAGKTTTRYFPFYSRAHDATLQSDFYMWPIYKYNRIRSDPLDRQRTRILFFLFSDTLQKSTETGASQRRTDFWPFYTLQRDYHGNTRLQVLAPLEPYVPGSKSIERDYSQLWSVWRAEKNPRTGAASQSLLWNLYRHETRPGHKKCSLLFGLFQYESSPDSKHASLFYIPIGNSGPNRPPSYETY